MSVDQKLLESFSSDQLIHASEFLEKIYVHDKTNIELNTENDITIFVTLIQASHNITMKQKLFFSLSVNSQKQCFTNLIYQDQANLLTSIKNNTLLIALFSLLEPSLQHEFLTNCFKTHIHIFNTIKTSLKPSFTMQHGLIIEKSKISQQQSDSYRNTLISYIKDPSFSIQDIVSFVDSLQQTLENDDLDIFVRLIFDDFKALKLPLTSKEIFSSYLKFFHISVSLVVMFPNHSDTLDSIIEHFLLSLDSISSADWVLKILDQLPIYILKKCCTSISVYEKIKNNKKRNIYMKFYKLINDYIQSDSDSNIKTAMHQL